MTISLGRPRVARLRGVQSVRVGALRNQVQIGRGYAHTFADSRTDRQLV
jgi:hypothetical protein